MRSAAHAWVAAGLAAVAIAVRAELISARSLWFDEGYSLFVARLGWPGILQFLENNDAHPGGYYLLLAAWMRAFGADLATLRTPSLLAGVASVLLTWLVARRCLGSWGAHVSALLVGLNPFQVYASNELRMYMPLQLVVLAATLTLLCALRRGGGWWALYGGLMALAGYFSYFAVLAFVPQLVWVVWRNGRKALRGAAVACGVGLALYAPWLPYLQGFFERNPQLALVRPSAHLGNIGAYLLGALASHSFGGYLPGTVTYHRTPLIIWPYLLPLLPFLVAAALGVVVLARGEGEVAVVTWLGGLGLVVAASLLSGIRAAYERNLVFLQPFAAMTVAAGVVAVGERARGMWGRGAAAVWATLLVALTWVALGNLQSGRPEFDAFRYDRAARFVDEQFQVGDLVVYFPTGIEHAFGYYFRKPAKSVSLAASVDQWDPAHLGTLFAALRPHLQQTRGRVWVVTSVPPTRNARPLDLMRLLWREVEKAGYRQVALRDFLGVQVALYRRGPQR